MVVRHLEKHFRGTALVRDVVIGMSDGLTVPFALAAGMAGAVGTSRIVLTAGLAEIAAGSIAMGLGGYLAAQGDAEHYASERMREQREVIEIPGEETQEIYAVLAPYGLPREAIAPVADALRKRPEAWVDFMMRFELGLEKPDPQRAFVSAFTIGFSYVVGGLVPLVPYMFADDARRALLVSAALTLVALLVFGFVKGRFTGAGPTRSALQTAVIGSLAATAAFGLARAFS
jgi:VIT1/CCC1 family predicted Fe2+/Mn2+ transporter